MTINDCPGGYFEPCPGGQTLILMKKRGGGILGNFDCVKVLLIMASRGCLIPVR